MPDESTESLKATPLISNFNGGELSPRLDARSDVERYYSGCRRVENFVPLLSGGVRRVPGTQLIAVSKYSSLPVIPV